MTEPGSNLARVLALWGEMSNGQTMAPLGEAMAEDVVWQGLLPELVCHGATRSATCSARRGAGGCRGLPVWRRKRPATGWS